MNFTLPNSAIEVTGVMRFAGGFHASEGSRSVTLHVYEDEDHTLAYSITYFPTTARKEAPVQISQRAIDIDELQKLLGKTDPADWVTIRWVGSERAEMLRQAAQSEMRDKWVELADTALAALRALR